MTAVARATDLFPDTASLETGHLVIGGCDSAELAEKFGTPLYVYDEATILARARAFRDVLRGAYPAASTVCYAAKAYAAPWLFALLAREGLGVDVVSGGELALALRSGFAADRIYLHGNNKSDEELSAALDARIGHVVVDNLDEISRLGALASARRVRQPVLLRVGPAVDVHTHEHLATGVPDTKFGLDIASGAADEGVERVRAEDALDLRGLHAHIGSQITDLAPYRAAIGRLFAFAARLHAKHGIALRELSPGGGYAVAYEPDDERADPTAMVRGVIGAVREEAERNGMPLPALTIEPGRSIVAPAAVALYRVGSVKRGARTYVAVDGGMADNIRPTAYGARYTAVIADRTNETASDEVAIAGKYCETGDILIQRVRLPRPRVGDLIAIPVAGAYHLAMASNYNMATKPAVVVVADGRARLVRRRETFDDLIAAELPGG